MTKHADRDHSEPYWPPAATREPRVRFPLDDGDTGAALLPVAPAGTLLRCPVCPAALADTRGGRLDHSDDGTHHYVPGPAHDPSRCTDMRCDTCLVIVLRDERDELRAEVERLRADLRRRIGTPFHVCAGPEPEAAPALPSTRDEAAAMLTLDPHMGCPDAGCRPGCPAVLTAPEPAP